VLCVADGEGRNGVWLAGQGLTVDAFDVAEVGVAKARRLAAERGVTVNFAVADCDAYPWPEGVYDGVAAIFVQFADPAMRGRLFAHIVRSLKPGGTLVESGQKYGSPNFTLPNDQSHRTAKRSTQAFGTKARAELVA
jgi:SAM-dependent methyltransferase